MRRAPELHDFIAALKRDPQAEPPPGMDPAVAELVRALVQDDRRATPSTATLNRIWQRAITDAGRAASRSAHRHKPSVNGRNGSNHIPHVHQTIVARPRQALHRRSRRAWMTMAASVIGAILFVALMLPAVFSGPDQGGPEVVPIAPAETNRLIFQRYIDEVWNEGQVEKLNGILTADHVYHMPGTADITGPDGVSHIINEFRMAFPDALFSIVDTKADEEHVQATVMVTLTQAETLTLPDSTVLAPVNRQITFEIAVEARFEDDGEATRIAELWAHPDGVGLWLQMNAFTEAAPDLAIKDQHIEAAFRLDRLLDERQPAESDLVGLVDPEMVIHDTTRNGTTVTRTYTDLSSGNMERDATLLDDGVSVEHIFAKGDLVAVQLLVREGTPSAPTWAEQITIYRFEEGRIVEMCRFWHRAFVETP